MQVGKMPTNGTAVLPHGRFCNLPPKHDPQVLRFILEEELEAHRSEQVLSSEDVDVLLEASDNAAFMLSALEEYITIAQSGTSASSMDTFLAQFTHDKLLLEVCAYLASPWAAHAPCLALSECW
jgi:hypothetical protein